MLSLRLLMFDLHVDTPSLNVIGRNQVFLLECGFL